jgi:predicted GIY-YIG superfamily endonuclease
VVEDRREAWQQIGERLCAEAPPTAGVYILRDEAGRAVYVGKSTNIRRRLRAHFARRRWRHLKADFVRAVAAEWLEVGSEIEALLREAMLIEKLSPIVNVQTGAPVLDARAIPASLVRDVVLVLPSIEQGAVELVAARAEGRWLMQRTRRDGADLIAHTTRLWRFFHSRLGSRGPQSPLAALVFSWLAGRGAGVTRIDPRDFDSVDALRSRLATLFADEALFTERIVVR